MFLPVLKEKSRSEPFQFTASLPLSLQSRASTVTLLERNWLVSVRPPSPYPSSFVLGPRVSSPEGVETSERRHFRFNANMKLCFIEELLGET